MTNGILSIVDRKGRYMGMQHIARAYLGGICIDISTQGPDNNPTAVIVTVYDEADRGKKLEDINYSATKADYNRNAIPDMFSCLLYKATTGFEIDKRLKNGTVYRIYNNGAFQRITYEEFKAENTVFKITCPE